MDKDFALLLHGARATVNALIDDHGRAVIAADGDTDKALALVANNIIEDPRFTRDHLAVLVAFASRRLWHKRSDPVKASVN